MKKTVKRLLVLLLALSMSVVAPVKVSAKTIKDYTADVTLYPKSSPSYSDKQEVGACGGKTKITNIKYTNKSIAKVTTGKESYGYVLYVQPKKTGKLNITYKIGKDTHKLKVYVKKYVNPYKQIKINGKNITSKFNKTNVCVLSYKQYKGKTVKLSFKKKKSWYMPHGDYLTKSNKLIQCIGPMSNPHKFKVTKKGSKAALWTTDTSITGHEMSEDCMIIFK